jgi:hypothetical protein
MIALRCSVGRLLVLIALCGCNQILGITPIHPSDGAPLMVTGTFHQHYATNDVSGAPVIEDYIPPSVTGSVVLDDGTQPELVYAPDGTFGFQIAHADQAYRLVMSGADTHTDVEAASSHLVLAGHAGARPSTQRVPVTLPTVLNLDLGTTPASEFIGIVSTGQWTTGFPMFSGGTLPVLWNNQNPYAPPLGLLDATKYHDQLYVLDFPNAPPAYSTVQHYARLAIDLSDGGGASYVPTMMPTSATSCVHLVAPVATAAAMLAQVVTDGTMLGSYWQIQSIPSYELGTVGALPVALSDFGQALGQDSDLDVHFFVPYVGGVVIAHAQAQLVRMLALPGTAGTPAQISTMVDVAVDDVSTCANVVTVAAQAAFAGDPSVAGTSVVQDATSVPIPTSGDVVVTWPLALPGQVDVAGVSLFELTAAQGKTVKTRLDGTTTAANSAHFDAAKFVIGHTYALQIQLVRGYPRIADGDYDTLAFPIVSSVSWSHWFTAR